MPSATAAPAESGVSEANLKLIIHHVFLTPGHPQGGDDIEATRACEHALLSFVCEALRKCASSAAFNASSALQTASAAILFLRDSKNASGALDPQKLQQAFKKLLLSGGVFPVHVEAQNAAIRVGRTKTSINFEFFELSPQNEAVMSTQGRLKRHFPGSAVSIPFEVFDDADLHSSIADTLTRMGLEEVKEVKAKIKKARDTQIEERDTTDPAIVTDFLATVLSALGDVTHAPVLEKNTREQVSWKNAKLPWRRSPVWLLARVTLQSIMSRAGEPQVYKQFMVFLLSSLLEAAVSAQMPAETLYHMECLAGGVEAAMAKAASCIEASWKTATQALETKLVMREITASFQQEKFFDCPKLDSFLESITSRRSYTNHLQFEPSWHLPTYPQSGLPPTTFGGEGQGKLVRLLAFEDWVANSLNNWLSLSIDLDYAPDRILELIRQYHEAAQPQYAGNPEATSLMILTIMELWVACDKSSCKKIELLKDFDHEIPRRLLQSLILPLKRDMERLHSIETYFQARQKDFEPKQNPSIFSDFGTKKSFAVQFFASSAKHQALKTSIEEWGNLEREKKRREFQQTLAVYREHVQKAAELDHDYFSRINWRTGKSRQVHDRHCRRCYHETLAQAQTIEIHEWPLPSDPEAAQNVVFELQVPKVVSDWRSATAYVILSVLKSIRSATMETGTEDTLSNYLPKYFVTVSANRFVLNSTTKSNRRTHRKMQTLATASEDSVLLRNGLTFHYYDKVDSKWVTSFDQTYKVPNSCTYQLSKSCDALQKFIFRPYQSPSGQSANHVISRQSACPEHLSLEEFRAMAALPCGYRVQWLNILTQLHMPTVDFANPDVVQMLLQISGQAGPPSESIHRASHQCLIDPHLISKCVRGMEACLHKIEENWESYHAVSGFTALASRLLSLSTTDEAAEKCLLLLRKCRIVVYRWMTLLQEKVKESEAESVRAEFLGNALQVARTCIATFDVEETRIHAILESPEDAAILIEAAITAHDAGCSVDGPQAISAHRYSKTLFRLFKYMSNEILEKRSPCLDMALKKSWSVYPGGATWEPVSHPYGHWMTTEMRTAETILPLQAHFNMLTGELLVNGNPLSRLPTEYEEHHMYAQLFGKMTLEVLPTDFPGTKLCSKKSYHNYSLFFGMGEASTRDFLLVAMSDSEIYDLVPPRVFAQSLPHAFVAEHVHWYNRRSQTLEFRRKDNPWEPSPDSNWTMRKHEGGWLLERQGQHILLALDASTVNYLASLLKPLEQKDYIHVFMDRETNVVTVELPRLQLDFLMEAGSSKLYSRQFRGMFVDTDQCIHTLVGLESKLVLRNKHNRRKVLIPDGEPAWSRVSSVDHVRVSIRHGVSKKVHPYDVDTLLQRLVDNGSLQSKLVICHLHALTSYCLPDGLTGKTGTEQALSILRSASLRSFEYLKEEDIQKLSKIAQLSPHREYYPKNLRCMETVSWDSRLSFLAQDNAFHCLVAEIFAQASATKVFYPDESQEMPTLCRTHKVLGNRYSIRASSSQVDGFGGENHTTDQDVVYQSRDKKHHSPVSMKAFKIAEMLFLEPSGLAESVHPALVQELWASLEVGVHGLVGDLTEKDICYGAKWMESQDQMLQHYWCQFHHLFAYQQSGLNRFQVMMCLCTMGFSIKTKLQPIQCLAAFFKFPTMFDITIPTEAHYFLSVGYSPVRAEIYSVATEELVAFNESPEFNIPQDPDEEEADYLERRRVEYVGSQTIAVETFVTTVFAEWICKTPTTPSVGTTHVKVQRAMQKILKLWERWYNNHCFRDYLIAVVAAVGRINVVATSRRIAEASVRPLAPSCRPQLRRSIISRRSMFASVPLIPNLEQVDLDMAGAHTQLHSTPHRLGGLLDKLREVASSEHSSQLKYADELQRSFQALKQLESAQTLPPEEQERHDILANHLRICQQNFDTIKHALIAAIKAGLHKTFDKGSVENPNISSEFTVAATFMAPRCSSSIILGYLARSQWKSLPRDWKRALVTFGTALTCLQRAERLLHAKTSSDLLKELANLGHTNWNPLHNPESLLLEIESGILIREVQENIASQMRAPKDEKNAVMQLNMGEGKSSVIVPAVAAYLADGSRLVRVVVGKPQAKELLRTLVSKLGGLLNRRIFHMPFNRSLRLKEQEVKILHRLYRECMKQGGVLLVQPEHMLSFKLMAVEYQSLANENSTGTALVDLYHFLHVNSRDIVDESDENFSPKFELIYTMGEQRPIELSPDRWTVLQRLLDVVVSVAPSVQKVLPEGIEITHNGRGRFPRTRILRAEAGALLVRSVTQRICDTGFPGLPIGRQNDQTRNAIFNYILEEKVSSDQIALVETNEGFFTDSIKGPLLLLRGLIAGRVLLFALRQKRWRVNYGLDPARTPSTNLAVPYRAKDSPSSRAEFSHPDVVILLTCLSYYYEGLTDESLFLAFSHLIKSDQSEVKFHEWIADAPDLPTSFRHLAGINLKDVDQVTREVFPHLRRAKNVVDYYLSHLVFSKEMKEFSHKLSSSGWDLGVQKHHATTGFSGTNDSRHVLPLDVKQLDIEEQLHTNALVLENLLRPENTVQLLCSPTTSECSGTEILLEFVAETRNGVHVILDVGAQVLELTNIQVAKKWLELLPSTEKQDAVVFFDDDDDICVIDRKGVVERLQISPYAEQLDRCLVFLDQAHTRGTDLKLPDFYKAAVTLGPDITKDRLVQACMRMRKLGQGQSVVFCVSREMQSRISMITKKPLDSDVGVDDVLMWAISETHADLKRLMPLWAIQGVRFDQQKAIWDEATTDDGITLSQAHAAAFLEEEAQTIEYRYRPVPQPTTDEKLSSLFARLGLEAQTLACNEIQQRCDEFGASQFRSAALQEEQEKELAPEVEQERQIERPRAALPSKHELHKDVLEFVATGQLPDKSPAFKMAFLTLSNTSVADWINVCQFPSDLLVTMDYSRTVQLQALQTNSRTKTALADSYQRPIQWILASEDSKIVAIISPYEAQELIPHLLKGSGKVRLHLYAPRTTLGMEPLDMLRLHTIPYANMENWVLPSHLRLQLNLFAGQLYFASFKDYADTCDMLSLAWRPSSADEFDKIIKPDGFIVGGGTRFTKSPVQGLRVLLTTLRRDCQGIDKTHWGRILSGEFLTEADFEK